jgi:hypothetical protein
MNLFIRSDDGQRLALRYVGGGQFSFSRFDQEEATDATLFDLATHFNALQDAVDARLHQVLKVETFIFRQMA